MGRHIDAPFSISYRFIRYGGTDNLHAGIQDCRVERKTTGFRIRLIGYLHFTQHIDVVSPQLCNALEERTVVDTVFAESLDNNPAPETGLRAPGPDFLDALLLKTRGNDALRCGQTFPVRVQCP